MKNTEINVTPLNEKDIKPSHHPMKSTTSKDTFEFKPFRKIITTNAQHEILKKQTKATFSNCSEEKRVEVKPFSM